MFCIFKVALLPLWPLAMLQLAQAQTPPSAKAHDAASLQRPDPADPKAAVPVLVYRSSFGRYQPYTEPELAAWRETNERVRQRGGWRAYAREAQEPAAPASSASQPASAVKPAMAGHEMK